MAQRTGIEWTDATWNPVRGCTKISPGCKNCYAEAFAERFRGIPGHPFEQGFDLRLVPEKLNEPLHWRKPLRIFVNSMSDLFHPLIPSEYIECIARVMAAADRHVFQVLTKRPERMRDLLRAELRWAGDLRNVWWGVSVEDRKHGVPRIKVLQEANAAFRFLSIEPLLENLGQIELDGIDWVIVGGESGAQRRTMAPEWVRNIRDQCLAANVPFFFKQWGGRTPKHHGRILDGSIWSGMPAEQRSENSAVGKL
jgi:protein gp37